MLQRCWWKATYADGTALQEGDPEVTGGPCFEDLERARLTRLGLHDPSTGSEVLALDPATGDFTVSGHRVAFWLGDRSLTGRKGVSYRDVLQFKSAHSDWRQGTGTAGLVVEAHHLGYRARLPEAEVRIVLRLDLATGRVSITVDFTPRTGEDVAAAAFIVAVDGVRIMGMAAFEASLSALSNSRARAPTPEVG